MSVCLLAQHDDSPKTPRSRRAGSRTCTRRRRRRAAGTRPAATRAPRAPRSSRARRGSRRARTYMRSVSSPPPPYHALSRHPASRRWRRETNAQSGRVDGVEAEAEKHTQSTPSTRSFKDTEQGTGADQTARARRRIVHQTRRCTVYNEAPSRARRTGSLVSSGRAAGRLRASRVTPSPRRAKGAGAAPWYTAT